MTTTGTDDFGSTEVPEAYRSQLTAAALRWGIPPALLAAQLNQESGFNPSAVSPDGALGIAQFMPGTAKSLGIDPLDPSEAIDGMAKLMSTYHDRYGSWEKALYAYHGGPGVVDSPGPNSRQYAQKILGKVGGLLSESAGTLPVGSLTDPLKNTTKLLSRFRDPAFLKRVGIGALGVVVVLLAVVFLAVQRSTGLASKVVNSETVKSATKTSGN